MRIHWAIATLLVSAGLTACRSEPNPLGVTGPAPVDTLSAPALPVVHVSLSVDRTEGLKDGDIVEATASLTSDTDTVPSSVRVTWHGADVVSTGRNSARYKMIGGNNLIIVTADLNGLHIASASVNITAGPNPGQVILWNPDGSLVRMPAPEGAVSISPLALNDNGEVVGNVSYGPNDEHAFVWSVAHGFKSIGLAPATTTAATAINNKGTVAGVVHTLGVSTQLFTWSESTGLVLVDGPPDISVSAINDAGHVAGSANGKPMVWSRENGFVGFPSAGVPSGGDFSEYPTEAVDLTASDEILASYTGKFDDTFDYGFWTTSYPAIWRQSEKTEVNCGDCIVSAMNDAHQIAGVLWHAKRAFRWSAATGVEMLPIGDGQASTAYAINIRGVIGGSVVTYYTESTRQRAAIWVDQTLTMVPDIAGSSWSQARDVNNAGQVLVYSR